MKFNLKETIPEVVEQYPCGQLEYLAVKVVCRRSDGIVSLTQGYDVVLMNEEQAKQLHQHLKSVFGD